uniref:Uncharacterized protein n=1 Tax=Accipiter nisus TaxID=211598 RepID=A0A8B9MJ49_9AVES
MGWLPPRRSGHPVPPETVPLEGEPELERLLQGGEVEWLERPLSPTRLQPLLPPEAQRVPEFEELARVLAEMPRPLKRRGSMEQSLGPVLPPTCTRQYQQLITHLLHRPPRRDEPLAPGDTGASSDLPPPVPCRCPPVPLTPWLPQELRSALRDPSSPRRRPGARVRLNPLVLLLDAALTGELDVVQQAVAEVGRDSGDRVAGTKAGAVRAGGQGASQHCTTPSAAPTTALLTSSSPVGPTSTPPTAMAGGTGTGTYRHGDGGTGVFTSAAGGMGTHQHGDGGTRDPTAVADGVGAWGIPRHSWWDRGWDLGTPQTWRGGDTWDPQTPRARGGGDGYSKDPQSYGEQG